MSAAGQIFADSVNHALSGIAENAEAKVRARNAQTLLQQRDELALDNAANLAEKQALRTALAQYCPDHPLLQNAILREKIQEAGRRAFALTDSWGAAREAGGTFKL